VAESSATLARDRVREARRLALIEAAEQVFAESGFAGATMAEIASRAGYSAGNVYNVFDGKEALFRAVVTARGHLLLERLEKALSSAPDLQDKVGAFVDALISFVEEHRAFFAIYLQRTSGIGWNADRLDEGPLQMQSLLERTLTHTLQTAIDKGKIAPEDPLLYTSLLLGTLQRYVTRWIQHAGPDRDLRWGADPLCRILMRAMEAR
jgi:AcrR family transcriptional regulator